MTKSKLKQPQIYNFIPYVVALLTIFDVVF